MGDPDLDDRLTTLMDTPVQVLEEGEIEHFDAAPVSILGTATLDWVRAELGLDGDPRRFRANLLVETDEPFVEETWVGREIAVGDVVLKVTKQVTRCRTVDLAQDGVPETAAAAEGACPARAQAGGVRRGRHPRSRPRR